MKLKSLALRTDLIFDTFSGEVIDRGEYRVVKTLSRPDYIWGNYLIFRDPPGEGDLERWIDLFEKEIGGRMDRGFMALTWDSIDGDEGEIEPFVDFGFSVQCLSILTASEVHEPPKYNPAIPVRPIESDADWAQLIDIHFSPDWRYGSDAEQRVFLEDEYKRLRAMVDRGLGMRFGAELEGRLVGELGIYRDGNVGRFNNVGTHRNFRRLGVCSTLVYAAAKQALESGDSTYLVMKADADYHAAGIYETVGFRPTEQLTALEWYHMDRT